MPSDILKNYREKLSENKKINSLKIKKKRIKRIMKSLEN